MRAGQLSHNISKTAAGIFRFSCVYCFVCLTITGLCFTVWCLKVYYVAAIGESSSHGKISCFFSDCPS